MPGQQEQDSLGSHRLESGGEGALLSLQQRDFQGFPHKYFLRNSYECNFANLVFGPWENLLVKTELAGGEEKEIKVLSHFCFYPWPKQQPATWHSDLFYLNLIFCQG